MRIEREAGAVGLSLEVVCFRGGKSQGSGCRRGNTLPWGGGALRPDEVEPWCHTRSGAAVGYPAGRRVSHRLLGFPEVRVPLRAANGGQRVASVVGRHLCTGQWAVTRRCLQLVKRASAAVLYMSLCGVATSITP